ncbi:MAG: CheR family methyltransferase [Bacteroidales bacterium]
MINVHSVDTARTRHISVQGNLQFLPDREQLFTQLVPGMYSELEITFFDIRVLPLDVVLRLMEFTTTYPKLKLKINVFHRYLGSYLFRLGIRSHVISQQTFNYKESGKTRAIVLAGSAGSLDKILAIMAKLPGKSIPVFIVQHILENEPNYLGELLERSTSFKIVPVTDKTVIRPGCVYIAPPGMHMLAENGKIRLSKEGKINFARPSIQVTFESLLKEYQDQLLAVILCGYGEDGVQAIPLLKQAGARVIIEDPGDCEAKDLLINSWRTGLVDYKFPLPELISYLVRIVEPSNPNIQEPELKRFFNKVHEQYGYDYRHYSTQSAIRRIARVMADNQLYSFRRFEELVLQDRDLFENLFLECSINVTDFFRNPETFRTIREKVLTYLDSFPHIKIWSAGCSTGQEAVSVAILLSELGILHKSQIYASDINPYVVEEAQNGIYSPETLEQSAENYLQSGGKKDLKSYFIIKDGYARVKPEVLERILYFQHSLLNRGAFNEFHLILCRNVLIYFDHELQTSVLELFFRSLDMNGFLVLGESESVVSYPIGFEVSDKVNKIFKKII